MKVSLKKIITLLLAAMLIVVSSCLLFACNKDKDRERDARLRADNVAVVKDKILSAMDEKWSAGLENSEVAKLDNAGDYVTAEGWTDMICEVLRKSALQTGKLTALKNAIESDDGQKLLKDFAGNAELLIPLMRVADFTPTDISNLTYDLLCALAAESGSAIENMIKRLDEVRAISGISANAVENIKTNSLNLAVVKAEFVPNEQEKAAMLEAFAKAKAPMGEIVEFAYNMSIGSITDNIFDALFSADGALSNITNSEISTVISSLIMNATSLKDALDDAAIANLNSAMGLIIQKFDKDVEVSSLYLQIVGYAKYAYMFVDIIPSMCEIMASAGEVFDTAMIEQLREVIGTDLNDNAQNVNSSIVISKILLATTNNFTANGLCSIVEKVGAQVKGEYNKTLPLFALDICLNLSSWFKDVETTEIIGKHPDIISESDVKVMLGTVFLTIGLDDAKKAYNNYKSGANTNISTLVNAINFCGFGQFGIENPYSPYDRNQVEAWYNYYMNDGVEEAGRKAVAVCQKAVNDIKAFIKDFYEPNSESKKLIEQISNWQFVGGNLSPDDYASYEQQIFKSDIIGLIGLIALLTSL